MNTTDDRSNEIYLHIYLPNTWDYYFKIVPNYLRPGSRPVARWKFLVSATVHGLYRGVELICDNSPRTGRTRHPPVAVSSRYAYALHRTGE